MEQHDHGHSIEHADDASAKCPLNKQETSAAVALHQHSDSMVTVRLSDTPSINLPLPQESHHVGFSVQEVSSTQLEAGARVPSASAVTMHQEHHVHTADDSSEIKVQKRPRPEAYDAREFRQDSDSNNDDEEDVDWDELAKKEELEPRNQDSEDSTALLLARLEQENNMLVTNPKSGLIAVQQPVRHRSESRPPSMHQLRKMIDGPTPAALRYSLLPALPMTDLEFYAALVQDYKQTAQRLPTLLSKKIRNGIPPPLRGVVWQSMSGARDRALEEKFDSLCGETSPYDGIIGKDLGRSFPGVEMFRDPDGDGQRMLGRVLKCFSLYDTEIGYCQGLGFLVGPLLMHMGDKQAFCILVRLMEQYDLRNCYLPDLSGLHVRIYQFGTLLRTRLPELNTHLETLQIEPAYVSQWFLSFFAVTCPLPMLFRIFDVIFAEGASETIMRVALAVMRKNGEKILSCTEFEDVMQLLLSRGLWDCYHMDADEFVNDFVSLTHIVTGDVLRAMESAHLESKNERTSDSVGSAASRFLGRLWPGVASNKSLTLSPAPADGRPISFLKRSPSKQSIASTLNSLEGTTDSIMSSGSTEATSRDSANTDSARIRAQSTTLSLLNGKNSSASQQHNLHGQIEDLLTALSGLQRDHAILATQLQREREEREEDQTAVKSLLAALKDSAIEGIGSSDSEDSVLTITQDKGDSTIHADDMPSPESEVGQPSSLACLIDSVQFRVDKTFRKHSRQSSLLNTKAQLREDLARTKEQLVNETSKSHDLARRIGDQAQDIANIKEELTQSHAYARQAHADKQRIEKQLIDLKAQFKQSNASTPTGDEPASAFDWTKRGSAASTPSSGLRELKLGRANSGRGKNGLPSASVPLQKRTSSLSTKTMMSAMSVSNKENMPMNMNDMYTESNGTIAPPQATIKDDITTCAASPPPDAETIPNAEMDALILELVQAKTAEAMARQEAEEYKSKLENMRRLLSGAGNGGTGTGVGTTAATVFATGITDLATSVQGHKASASVQTLPGNVGNGSTSNGVGGGFFSAVGLGAVGLGGAARSPEARRDVVSVNAPPAASSVSAAPAAAAGFWGWGKRSVSTAGAS